jgi:hypothetical protein
MYLPTYRIRTLPFKLAAKKAVKSRSPLRRCLLNSRWVCLQFAVRLTRDQTQAKSNRRVPSVPRRRGGTAITRRAAGFFLRLSGAGAELIKVRSGDVCARSRSPPGHAPLPGVRCKTVVAAWFDRAGWRATCRAVRRWSHLNPEPLHGRMRTCSGQGPWPRAAVFPKRLPLPGARVVSPTLWMAAHGHGSARNLLVVSAVDPR